MLANIQSYLGEGLYYLKNGLAISLIIYAVILLILWITKGTSLLKIKVTSIKKVILEYFLVLTIITILQITGIIGMSFRIDWFIDSIKHFNFNIPFVGSSILMITLNFILFIPLGFLIPAVFKDRNLNFKKVFLIGFLISFFIEFLQLFAGRFFENNHDLILKDVRHILYNLNDGTIYISTDDSDNFTKVLKYENKEYPFQINQNLYKRIKELFL